VSNLPSQTRLTRLPSKLESSPSSSRSPFPSLLASSPTKTATPSSLPTPELPGRWPSRMRASTSLEIRDRSWSPSTTRNRRISLAIRGMLGRLGESSSSPFLGPCGLVRFFRTESRRIETRLRSVSFLSTHTSSSLVSSPFSQGEIQLRNQDSSSPPHHHPRLHLSEVPPPRFDFEEGRWFPRSSRRRLPRFRNHAHEAVWEGRFREVVC